MKIKIGQIPRNASYLLADVLELILYFQTAGSVSKSGVEDLFNRGDLDPDWIDQEPNLKIGLSSAEKVEIDRRDIDDCFSQIRYRSGAFHSSYPYMIRDGVVTLREELDYDSQLYLFLLACSRLRSFPRNVRANLASVFEVVGMQAMRKLLPDDGVVRIFGANSEDRRNYYGTDFRDALFKLGEDLGEDVISHNIEQESPQGDGGVDVVGYIRFEDRAKGCLAYFAQCAAREKDWPKKTLEAHPLRFMSFLNFSHLPANIVFIPICYRQANGNWVKNSSSSGAVLLDRLRICTLLRSEPLPEIVREQFLSDGVLAGI